MKFLSLLVLISVIVSVSLKEQTSKSQTGAKITSVSATSTYNKNKEKKANFVEVSQVNIKELCLESDACEKCAVEWDCSYGVKTEDNQKKELECFQYCIRESKDADLHKKIMEAEGTQRQK